MAARYWVGTTSDSWENTANWSDTSGGSGGFSVPTSADDVIFDGNGNNPCTIDTTLRFCLSFTVNAGFTNTITHDQILTVSGNVTLHSGYTIAGSSALRIDAACTFTSGGKTWPNNLEFRQPGNYTVTISGNLNISGTLIIDGVNVAINKTTTETITAANGLNLTAGSANTCTGTINVILTGGTLQTTSLTVRIAFNVELNGNITLGTTIGWGGGGTIKYTSGTITTTGNTIQFQGSGSSIDTNGMTWNNVTLVGSTSTLVSNMSIGGLLNVTGGTCTINRTTTQTVTCSEGITVAAPLSGTAKVILTGGTWSGSNTTGIANDLDLQGNITVSGNVYYRTGTLQYVSGTITVTSSTLNITGSCTLNTNGMSWNNANCTTTSTVTLTSNFSMTGLFSSTAAWTINRTVAETWTCSGGATLTNGVSGTAKFILTGGTWSAGSGNGWFGTNLDLQGNITVSGTVYYRTNTIKYVSGTITTTGSTLFFNNNAAVSIDCNGMTWNNITFNVSGSRVDATLLSNLSCSGLFTFTGGSDNFLKGAYTFYIGGGISAGQGLNDGGGTGATLELTGGTWSTTNQNGIINLDLRINGNITVSGNVYYSTGTLSYISGTVTTAGSTLNIVPVQGVTLTVTLNTNGITWNDVSLPVTATTRTITINSLLSISGTFTMSQGPVTFNGIAGWTCSTFISTSTLTQTITLQEGITYTINSLFDHKTTRIGAIALFTSSHASNRANLVMPNNGNNVCNVLASFTRIDASGGRSICTFGGTVTDCVNVVSYTDYHTISGV